MRRIEAREVPVLALEFDHRLKSPAAATGQADLCQGGFVRNPRNRL